MRLFKDIFSGDEICSDSYPILSPSPAVMEVVTEDILVGGEQINTGSNPAEGETEEAPEGVRKNNLMSAHNLVELRGFTKDEYKERMKVYMKDLKKHLSENNPGRVDDFMKEAIAFYKIVLAGFDDYQFFVPESYHERAMLIVGKYCEDNKLHFYFWVDGMKGENI